MLNLKTDKYIMALGDVNPDMVLPYGDSKAALEAVARGEKAPEDRSLRATMYSGGTIGNVASGLSRLGMKTYFAGSAGKDAFSDFLTKEFEEDGVDCKYFVRKEGLFTCLVTAVVGADKERILYCWPTENAAHHQLLPTDLPDSALDEIGWVHTSGIILREDPAGSTIVQFLEKCRERGIIVSFDLNLRLEAVGLSGGFADRIRRTVECSNILLGSGVEEFMPLAGLDDPVAAAKKYVRDDRIVVSRSGKYGMSVYTTEEEFYCPTFDVEVVDTIGAGDASNAGFIAAAASGKSLWDCATWSNGAATYALQHIGARQCPNREVLEKFIKETPILHIKD